MVGWKLGVCLDVLHVMKVHKCESLGRRVQDPRRLKAMKQNENHNRSAIPRQRNGRRSKSTVIYVVYSHLGILNNSS